MSEPPAIELLGHRGARGLAPENALPGFARALAVGVSGFELDCAITRDGAVVIHHDSVLNPDFTRGPDGNWLAASGPAIRTLTFAELQRFDVGRIQPGSDYSRRFPVQEPADGTRIPRLADLFALLRKAGNEAARCYLELKLSPLTPERTVGPVEFAAAIIDAVREAGMTKRVAILSFDWRALAAARKAAPEIPTIHLSAQQGFMDNILAGKRASPWTAGLRINDFGGSLPRMVSAAGGAGWAPYYEELTRERVEEARALGLKVVTWTVNEPAAMRRLIEWRVDAIISDYPDALRKTAGEMGVALPPPTPVAP